MKILLGISGGVDSAYAAKKLMDEGHLVEGAILVMHEYTELSLAREVAQSVGFKLHEIDCRKRFSLIVKDNFVKEYSRARTPNPCIICNQSVKFAMLSEYARNNGFDAIATGHYSKVVSLDDNGTERYAISVARDVKKDQSYVLYRLSQEILSHLVFPLSDMTKEEVREAAAKAGISSADRKDSQEICFLPDGGHAEYIESVKGRFPEGDFIDENGKILGKHKGIIRYTVGQRKGLGIALGERAFVTKINPDDNTVTLSSSLSGKTEISISDIVYSGIAPINEVRELTAYVKIRYTAPLVEAKILLYPDGKATLTFGEPLKTAPGQSAVVYKDGCVLFGGFID